MRTQVDQYLASLYPVDQSTMTSALYKMAEQENLDLDSLTPEQLEELAQAQEQAMTSQDVEPAIKEAQANLELADYMGRIMAHSYHQELGLIEKQASMSMGGFAHATRPGQTNLLPGAATKDKVSRYAGKALDAIKKHKGVAAGVGAAGAAGAAGYAAGKKSEKTASAFDTLARQYAMQILQQQGADTTPFQQMIQQQDQQDQMMSQQQQYGQQGMPQQSAASQMMSQQGQMQQGQQGQGMQQRQMGQQRQMTQQAQPQQQNQQMMAQQELGMSQEQVKQANDMAQGQLNEAIEAAAWQMLSDAGYQIDEGQQQGQMQGGMPQQQMMGQQGQLQ